jgi:SAM-dependent MidA family methyltransferase
MQNKQSASVSGLAPGCHDAPVSDGDEQSQRPIAPASAAERGDSLSNHLAGLIHDAGGWLPFDRFMSAALYTPGLGYYNRGAPVFGDSPASGTDFVTAPELSPLFGRALARQVAQALQASGTAQVYEFGAGSGALAEQLLDGLQNAVQSYTIIDVSGALRQRQAERLQAFAHKVTWLDAWPDHFDGVVVGNEVLDAMPVQLLVWDGSQWAERGVVCSPSEANASSVASFGWADRPTSLRPPFDGDFLPGYLTEVHPQGEAFISSLAQRLRRGAAFFIDYGFPEAEYYHPQRTGGTLMCHLQHRADPDPLHLVGEKDITAHVNFTAIALAGQNAGLDVLGYTSQARFLVNCGFLSDLQAADWPTRSRAQMLIQEHEMGELFKVIGFARGVTAQFLQAPLGFLQGDRTHTL